MTTTHTYCSFYVLSDEVGTILAVYGSALGQLARDKGKEIKAQTGAAVALHYIGTTTKPRVGDSISMRGAVEWL